MHNGRASETAVLAAMQRAAHLLLDNKPWVFHDDLAAALCGKSDAAAVLAELRSFESELAQLAPAALVQSWMQAARLSTVLRARFAEDELHAAIERGVSQYVILGAGLDSFAYRRRDLASLRVFEVDSPATQRRKLTRLAQLQIPVPPHVTFVPIDFETDSILETLQWAGYRQEEPAFFSWLGVVQYLTAEAVDRTLAQIARAASGSEIVLNYLVPADLVDAEDRQLLQMLEFLTVARGEPARTYFEPARLAERTRALGFADVWDMGAEEANSRYLSNRCDGLRMSSLVHLAKARVHR